jgi:hypothetical protein
MDAVTSAESQEEVKKRSEEEQWFTLRKPLKSDPNNAAAARSHTVAHIWPTDRKKLLVQSCALA